MNGRQHDSARGSEAGETDRSRGNREHHGRNRSPNLYRKAISLAEMLKRQFRKVAISLTGRAHEEEREERHRTERTGGGMRPSISVRIPLEAISPVTYLSEMLDCLNPFYGGPGSMSEYDEEFQNATQDHLFPDLEI